MTNNLRITKLNENFYLNLVNRIKDNKQFNIYLEDYSMPFAENLVNTISKPLQKKSRVFSPLPVSTYNKVVYKHTT